MSDLSGDEISEGKGATVTIKFNDARKGSVVLDVTDVLSQAAMAHGDPDRNQLTLWG